MADGSKLVTTCSTLGYAMSGATVAAAMAAEAWVGRGDEQGAEEAAASAMRDALNIIDFTGHVVVGEVDISVLNVGETVGTGDGPEFDIALEALEGVTLTAKAMPNALAVIAAAPKGGLLQVPDLYMEKLAIGPGYPPDLVDLDMPPEEAIGRFAEAKGVQPADISVCILDRPRHAGLIARVRATGASIRLIGDGDVAGIMYVTDPETTGIDIYMGSGGAPEGVLAAAALRCIGGQMLGRLIIDSDDARQRLRASGIKDAKRVYRAEDMAAGDVLFAATGITDGSLFFGIRFGRDSAETYSIVTRSETGTQRWIRAKHKNGGKWISTA
jgi:fructose-1,6-bisphosphatase II / sedoheptulose-1,7-bisphosphatase